MDFPIKNRAPEKKKRAFSLSAGLRKWVPNGRRSSVGEVISSLPDETSLFFGKGGTASRTFFLMVVIGVNFFFLFRVMTNVA